MTVELGKSMEHAIIARDRMYFQRVAVMSSSLQRRLVDGLEDEHTMELLEILLEMYEKKELRAELLALMKNVLLWKREQLILWNVCMDGEVRSKENKRISLLRKMQSTISRGKIGMGKLYELKGKLEFLTCLSQEGGREAPAEKKMPEEGAGVFMD